MHNVSTRLRRIIPIVEIELIITKLLLLLCTLAKASSAKRKPIEKEKHV